MSEDNKWVYSNEEEDGWGGFGEEYESREAAIEAAKTDPEIPPGSTFFTGKLEKARAFEIKGSDFLDAMQEAANDEYGEELAGDWLPPEVEPAKLEELSKAMTDAFKGWLEANNLMPDFFSIEDVQPSRKTL